MRALLLLLGLASGGAAAYLAWDRAASDLAVIGAMLLAVLALALFQLTPAPRPDVRLRPGDDEPPSPPRSLRPSGGEAPKRSPRRLSDAKTPAERRELAELAENLAAVAGQRGSATERDVAAASHVDLYLLSAGRNQIAVIKELRAHLGYGLKEAKDLTDAARKGQRPVIARQMPADRARNIARAVAGAGGKAELR